MGSVLLVLAAAIVMGATPSPSRPWISANYLVDGGESGYPRVAGNRFRQAWVESTADFTPLPFRYRSIGGRRLRRDDSSEAPFVPPKGFDEGLSAVLGCVPQLSQYRDELFVAERASLRDAEAISFFLLRFRSEADTEPLWLSSFIIRSGDQCSWFPETPAPIGLDRGGSYREVWDVFDYRGSRFVVTQRHDYEYRAMELFVVGLRWTPFFGPRRGSA